MRQAWQAFSALFGSGGPVEHPEIPPLALGLCAALAYPLAMDAGYGGAVGGAFVFCVATLFLAYSLASGALAFTVEATRSCLPGLQRLRRRAISISGLLLLALAVIPAAVLARSPFWAAWVPTALVLGIALAGVAIALLPVGAVGLVLVGVLIGYWAVRGPADHERDMELVFALLSAALALPAVAKWRRVIHPGSRLPRLAGLLRTAWTVLRRRSSSTRARGVSADRGGCRDRTSRVKIIRKCLGGPFTPGTRRMTLLAALAILALLVVVIGLPTPGPGRRWHWTIALVAFLSATLLWNGYLGRLSKLTRADIAELALLPGLGDAAAQCSALCWAVLAPPLPWLAWILLWASAGFALKGAPLSSVGILTAYLFIIWLTYLAIALLKLATYPPSRRTRLSHFSEFPLLYFSVYLCAVNYNIYTLHAFVHGGPLFWAFWATPTLVGIGFASAIGYAVHRLATAPHPFVARDSAFSSS